MPGALRELDCEPQVLALEMKRLRDPCCSKCSSQTNSTSLTREHMKYAGSQASVQSRSRGPRITESSHLASTESLWSVTPT